MASSAASSAIAVPAPPGPQRRTAAVVAVVVMLAAIAVLRIAATYSVYSQTVDEPEHIAGGLEWWQDHKFTMDAWHVPLGPALLGAAPYFSGARLGETRDNKIEGNRYLHAGPDYFHRLTLGRIGVLPLFLLAVWAVAIWARKLAGDLAAIAAVLLFTTSPPVLAHAGLATTDTAIEATCALALFMFVTWFAAPTWRNALLLGIAGGLALSAKVSAIPFLLAAGVLVVLARLVMPRSAPMTAASSEDGWWRRPPSYAQFAVALVCALAVLWGMYRFSWGPYPTATGAPSKISGPAPEFIIAVRGVKTAATQGEMRYFLGKLRMTGSRAFFPIAVLVKTPIPFVGFLLVGTIFAFVNARRTRDWRQLAPMLGAAAIMAVGISSNLNLGLRHVLAIYPLMAIVAGVGIAELRKLILQDRTSTRHVLTALIAGLLVWQVAEGIIAHPDYLPYFNQFAGGEGERIMIDSDLDWGQDLYRLSLELKKRNINDVYVAYFGSADTDRFGIVGVKNLPARPVAGWIAISEYPLKEFPGAFGWLERYRPVGRVGKSIRLYHIEPAMLPMQAPAGR